MPLIDTHCHLYLPEFADDLDAVVQRAAAIGIDRFYLPGIDSEVIDSMLALETRYPGQMHAMMGLHPVSVAANYEAELAVVEAWLARRHFCAVGEIGLDFYWSREFETAQYIAFNRQMEMALHYKRPIVIHTRNAMQETINAVKPFAQKGLKGIFHCFSGSYESATQIVNMGFLLGIGGVLTYKNAGLPTALANIDIENMVLETDAPYLTPVPFRGKRNESSYLQYVVQKLVETKGLSAERIAQVTTQHALTLFGN
jgi:TatD DNase family protein